MKFTTKVGLVAIAAVLSKVKAFNPYPITYALENFEKLASDEYDVAYKNDIGHLDFSLSDDSVVGKTSLHVKYNVTQTENWGGWVSWRRIVPHPHMCRGAEVMSFYYKILEKQTKPERAQFRIKLDDDSDCDPALVDCEDPGNWEVYFR